MKKITKLRKIHMKKSRKTRRRPKMMKFTKKQFYEQIASPLNSNEYLIKNGSSPFFMEEEDCEEENPIFFKSQSKPLKFNIGFGNNNFEEEIDFFSLCFAEGLDSTREESAILSEKSETAKGNLALGICVQDEKK